MLKMLDSWIFNYLDKTFTDNQGEHGRDRQESVDLQVEMARSYLDYAMSELLAEHFLILEMV